MKKFITLFAAAFLFMFSVTAQAQVSNGKAEASELKYSGEEIFRGVLFGQGEVAELFPELWNEELLKATSTEEAYKAVDNIIAGVKEYDKNYFKKLENAFKKKDAVKIDQAFKLGTSYVQKYVEENKLTVKNEVTPYMCGPTVCGLVLISYGAVYHVGAVVSVGAFYLTVWAEVSTYGPDSLTQPDLSNNFNREMLVKTLIERIS